MNLEKGPLLQDRPPSPDNVIGFGRPDIGPFEIQAVWDVFRSGWLANGPAARQLEQSFAQELGGGLHAVAVTSCTEALILSMLAMGIGPGHEVLVPAMTFCATVNAVLQTGATPVFVDVTPSGHIDPALIKARITPRTRAVIPVHYTGAACAMDDILAMGKMWGLAVIEDAAHGWGGEYVAPMTAGQAGKRAKLGTLGDFGCFSFYATKNITTGEGGMVVTRSQEMAEKIECMAMQGLSQGAWKRYGLEAPAEPYRVIWPGRKASLSDIQAAIGLVQLKRWPEIKAKRDAIWAVYEDAWGLKEPGHSKHLFTIRHPKRDALKAALTKKGVLTGIHFRALHMEPAYVSLGYRPDEFPTASLIGDQTLSLPVSSQMSVDDARRVVETVKECEALL